MLRVRLKVWVDPETGQRYIVSGGVPILKDRDDSIYMKAMIVSDSRVRFITVSLKEWENLEFFYFKEDGVVPPGNNPSRLFDKV